MLSIDGLSEGYTGSVDWDWDLFRKTTTVMQTFTFTLSNTEKAFLDLLHGWHLTYDKPKPLIHNGRAYNKKRKKKKQ